MQIISSLPGRVRFKNPHLYYNKELSKYINYYIETLAGVNNAKVNYNSATILIEYDTEKISQNRLEDILNLTIDLAVNKNNKKDLNIYKSFIDLIDKKEKAKKKTIIYGLIYIFLKTKQSTVGKFSISRNIRVLQVASIVTIIGGYPLLKGFYKNFMKHVPTDADILLKLTAVSFTLLRESNKGVFVLFMKSLSDYIKYSAMLQCQKTIKNIKGNFIDMVLKRDGAKEEFVSLEMLSKGDVIHVKKGEIISVNGKVLNGTALVSNLYQTGQVTTDKVLSGDDVLEGMYVVSGDITIEVTSLPQSIKKDILSLDKLEMHSKIKSYQNKITNLAITAAAASYAYTRNIMNALSTLLVMTPSASMTALNTGMNSYINLLKKRNIYIRNINCVEKASKIDAVIFDKTGTLTEGNMKFIDIEVIDKKYSKEELLNICAACEISGMHPISKALNKFGNKNSLNDVNYSMYLPSKGIYAEHNGLKVVIGNEKIMYDYKIDIKTYLDKYNELQDNLYTPIFIAIDQKLSGMVILKDMIREDATYAINRIKSYGINNLTLLTGDKYENAEDVANRVGINRIYSECTVEEKSEIVKKIARHNNVLMVGDGVNDVLAMKQADVSVSLSNSSCDRVFTHSDCIILENNLTTVPEFISLSKKSYTAINNTLNLSRLYNLILGGFAFFGYFDAFTAKSLNTLNSLIVLLLNKRIEYIIPDMVYKEEYIYDSPQSYKNQLITSFKK